MKCTLKSMVVTLLVMLVMSSCHSSRKNAKNEAYVPPFTNVVPHTGNHYSQALVDEAFTWMGTPYRLGGTSRKGIDCSAFMMEVFSTAVGVKLPRNSKAQSEYCTDIRRSDLSVGDLVFFKTDGTGKVSHVGMYIGGNCIIHASGHGVMVSSLDEKYWSATYHHCGRVDAYAAMVHRGKTPKGSDLPAGRDTDLKTSPDLLVVGTVSATDVLSDPLPLLRGDRTADNSDDDSSTVSKDMPLVNDKTTINPAPAVKEAPVTPDAPQQYNPRIKKARHR